MQVQAKKYVKACQNVKVQEKGTGACLCCYAASYSLPRPNQLSRPQSKVEYCTTYLQVWVCVMHFKVTDVVKGFMSSHKLQRQHVLLQAFQLQAGVCVWAWVGVLVSGWGLARSGLGVSGQAH